MTDPKALLKEAFWAGLEAVEPAHILPPHLPPPPKGRLVVLGAGKAAAAMARTVEAHYQPHKLEGFVITRYGHALPTRNIEVVEAGHPVPDEAGRRATARALSLAHSLGPDDLMLCLISGGGSALLTAPDGVGFEQKIELTRALLRSGADITEMNTVRKHLSKVKGGRLAAAAAPACVLSLILSDVAGDDLSSVASGPTVPDSSTFEDALSVLDRYNLPFPEVRRFFEKGIRGEVPETPKPSDAVFERVENTLIGSAQGMLERVADSFLEHGVTPLILSDSLTGEAREAARFHAALARQVVRHAQPVARPCALLSGGETTVTVRGGGRGGRNGEFLLELALELRGLPDVYALAADTDGIDGSEDNAGAVVGPNIFEKVGVREALRYLENNDSYSFFAATDALFVTGPTHTNVNDLRIILIR